MTQVTPRLERLQIETNVKEYLDDVVAVYTEINASTYEDAQFAREALYSVTKEAPQNVPGISTVPLRLRGTGVLEPEIKINDGEDSYDFHAYGKLRPLDEFEERTVNLERILPQTMTRGDGITATAMLMFRNVGQKTLLATEFQGYPLVSLSVQRSVLYTCDGSPIDISLPYVEQQQEREQMFFQLAREGAANGKLLRSVDALDQQLQTEDNSKLQPLKDMGIVYSIADQTGKLVWRNPKHEDNITSLLLHTFGKGRSLSLLLKYGEVEIADAAKKSRVLNGPRKVQGELLDVVMKGDNTTDDSRKLSLALTTPDDGVALVPLKHIDALYF